MTEDDHAASDGILGQCWNQLYAELRQWLAWRIRPPLDVDDIASEVVFRGLRGRNLHLLPRPKLWGWATRTARNYTTDLLRRNRYRPCMLTGDADRWVRPDPDALPACSSLARELVAELRRLAEGLRLQVLEALIEADVTSRELAARFGRSLRAIEHARQWLREACLRLENQRVSLRS